MKDIINVVSRNQSIIYKIFLFVASTFLIIYFFPKGGQFKYNFQKGKPWQYENLYAPFSFTIKKDAEALTEEQQEIRSNAIPYFEYDAAIVDEVKEDFNRLLAETYVDSLYSTSQAKLKRAGIKIIDDLYKYGVTDQIFSYDENKLVYLKNGNQISEINFNQIVKTDNIKKLVSLPAANISEENRNELLLKAVIDIAVKPNIQLDTKLTEASIKAEIDAINPNRGIIEQGGRIVAKGEVVEGDKYQILESLKS